MNFDLILARQITVLSLFFGALCGLITLIPIVGMYSLIFLICFIAPLVFKVFKKDKDEKPVLIFIAKQEYHKIKTLLILCRF